MIPRWVSRLLWMFRGKRLVRLHLMMAGIEDVPSVEGVLVGRWGGHYVLLGAKMVTPDGLRPLDGSSYEVPAENVVGYQVLT